MPKKGTTTSQFSLSTASKIMKKVQILYVFFWVFPRRPIVVCRRFGTLYQFHLQGLDVKFEIKVQIATNNVGDLLRDKC